MFCTVAFHYFCRHLPAGGNYLEIGVFNGDSIAALARMFPDKQIYGVDPFIEDGCTVNASGVREGQRMPAQRENAYRNIEGLSNVAFYEMPSRVFARIIDVDALGVTHVLIDGSHHYEDAISDAHLAMRLIGQKAGAVVFDDVDKSGVAKAYKEFLGAYAVRYAPAEDLYPECPGHVLAHAINSA